jgi:hypothetical protein
MRLHIFFFSLQLGDPLGEGAFGQVFKGLVIGLHGKLEPTIVAVKMLKCLYSDWFQMGNVCIAVIFFFS